MGKIIGLLVLCSMFSTAAFAFDQISDMTLPHEESCTASGIASNRKELKEIDDTLNKIGFASVCSNQFYCDVSVNEVLQKFSQITPINVSAQQYGTCVLVKKANQ